MRVIDVHIHNWNIFADPGKIRETIERFGIDWVTTMSSLRGGTYPSVEEIRQSNDETLALMRTIPEHVIGFCYANPLFGAAMLEEVKRCWDEGMLGLKLWVATLADDERNFPLVEAAIARNLPILVHTWKKSTGNLPHESTALNAANLARRYPEGKFIMAHICGDWEFGLKAVRDVPNLRVDFAGTVNERGAYECAVALLGPERVVFGTDMPACYWTNYGRVKQCKFSAEVEQKIFAGNFESMLPGPLPY